MFDFDKYGFKYAKSIKEFIVDNYGKPGKSYHNLNHVALMLDTAERLIAEKRIDFTDDEKEDLFAAILFHDIHYSLKNPPGLNECLSIVAYVTWNQPVSTSRVIEAINATAYHLKDQWNLRKISKFILDLDLYTFSLPWDEYLKYAELVIDELEPIFKTRMEAQQANDEFLKAMLERKQLYYIMNEWEHNARNNIYARIYCTAKGEKK